MNRHDGGPVGVQVKRLPHGEGLDLPAYATAGAAGMDVLSAEDVTLDPGARHAVSTGLSVAIPDGYEIQVRPRSGLAFKFGVTVPNTPGTIDSDYRGELKVLMINHGTEPFPIKRGERIAQLVLAPVVQAVWQEVDVLDETLRGSGGFGSTGRQMFGISGLGPGGLLIAAAALIVWVLILVWLSERILQFVGKRTAWGPLDPRNMVGSFLLLLGAIHFGNYALDLLESAMGGRSADTALTFPNAFLIGSVAIAVGIAAIRWRRKQQ